MEIRIKDTGQVMYESEFRQSLPNTALPYPLTEEMINAFGGEVVFEAPQAQPTRYQFAFRDGVEQIEGKWYTKYSVADLDAKGIAQKDAEQAKNIRENRDKMLSESDWTQVADAPVDKEAWAIYRQALRDLPTQAGFPWEVKYPEKP